jgi:hypothetical protein
MTRLRLIAGFVLIIVVSLSMIFFGLDPQDSPYHLLHYKLRLIYKHSILSDFLGVMLTSLIARLNQTHNTMILLRIINWFLVNIPLIFLFLLHVRKNKLNMNVSWLIILLLIINIPTNWNTLCWDSWNRLYWFFILWFLIVKGKSYRNAYYLNPLILSIITVLGIGIKTPNVLVVPIFVFYVFLKKEQPIKIRILGICAYMMLSIAWIALFHSYNKGIFKFFNLAWYTSEVTNTTHNLYSLILTNLEQMSFYLVLRVLMYFFKKKSAFDDLLTLISFSLLSLIGYNFINIPNSGLAFLVLFLYFEYIYFIYGLNIKGIKSEIIWFALIPLVYSAGSDLCLYKSYWVVPQTLGLLFVFHGGKILSRLDINFSIAKLALVLVLILSVNNQLFGDLYKSSKLVRSTKSLDQQPFGHINIDYYQKNTLNNQSKMIRKYWDNDMSRTNVVLGGQSFIFSNHIEFSRKAKSPMNYYLFKSIHAGIHDSLGVLKFMEIINDFTYDKKPSTIFNFVKYHKIPTKSIFEGDTIEMVYDNEGLQIFKVN